MPSPLVVPEPLSVPPWVPLLPLVPELLPLEPPVVSMLEPDPWCLLVRELRWCLLLVESLLLDEEEPHPEPLEPWVLVPSLPEVPDLWCLLFDFELLLELLECFDLLWPVLSMELLEPWSELEPQLDPDEPSVPLDEFWSLLEEPILPLDDPDP